MIRKYLLPLLAVLLIGFSVYQVPQAGQKSPPPPPPIEPAHDPFGCSVAGAGIVEAQAENIEVGSLLPGVVADLFVKEGRKVRAGDPLFRLDDRQLQAELKMRQAAVEAAQAELQRLEKQPRPEELPVREAQMREAQAGLDEAEDQLERVQHLFSRRVSTEEEFVRRRLAVRAAEEQLARAKAEFELLKAGAWEPEIAIARASVVQAQAQLAATETELERLTVRALVDGTVLQVAIRPGEFAGAPPGETLIVLGDIDRLHVRVDIDEYDVPRFEPGAPAVAMLRGNPDHKIPLAFVRVQPYVTPKRSLTGDNTERVDTRVLQVIYAFDPTESDIYVGQQLDVFIQTAEPRRRG